MSLPYRETALPLFPIEILVRNGVFDCKRSVLYAALEETYGIPANLILFEDHIAVAVNCHPSGEPYCIIQNQPYYYAECTSNQFRLGEIPKSINENYVALLACPKTATYLINLPREVDRHNPYLQRESEGQFVTE